MLLSPALAILLHYSRALLCDQWEVRQVAACGLAALLEEKEFKEGWYSLLTDDYQLVATKQVDLLTLLRDVLARDFTLMLKDQFMDSEDITILVPVRTQAKRLLIALGARIPDELELLVTNLP